MSSNKKSNNIRNIWKIKSKKPQKYVGNKFKFNNHITVVICKNPIVIIH